MTITEVDLIKHEGTTDDAGSGFEVEYDITFTGAYDPFAVKALDSITHLGSPVDLEIGAEIAADTGIYLRRRRPKVIDSTIDGGSFTLELSYRDGVQYIENPLMRKDTVEFLRYDESKPISKDALGRYIATSKVTAGDPPTYDPIEIFADKPTTNVAKFAAIIRGFREEYLLSFDSDSEYNVVNHANVTIDGVTFPPKTLRYAGGRATRDRINGYLCVAHEWRFEIKTSWNLKILNHGNYEFASGGNRRRIIDPDTKRERPVSWPISALGVGLPNGWTEGDLVYLEFENSIPANYGYFDWEF
jgi:hypothetical protein